VSAKRRRDHVFQTAPRPLDHGDVEQGCGILSRLGHAVELAPDFAAAHAIIAWCQCR
jgi:hypothetical protein